MNYDDASLTTSTTTTMATPPAGAPQLRHPSAGVKRWRPATQDDLAPSGPRARVRANMAVLKVLAELGSLPGSETGGVGAVAADEAQRRILARWSGWGAVPAVFDQTDPRWADERAQLAELLDAAALAAAARSTLNAHYTDLGIVTTVWDAVTALGFRNGTVLEPGCGSGNFLHHAPDGARVVAVEQDPTTARIAAALHPQATVRCESFADTPLADGTFDLAIGNVPFGAVTLHDRRHNPRRLSIHDHFVVKSLALVRPGGLVAVLTSRYTLDARNPAARREIAGLGDLVGAIRLPSGAHDRAAGTDAVSDLLILRRRDEHAHPRGPLFERTTTVPGHPDHDAVAINGYFAEHPQRVLGGFSLRRGPYSASSLHVEPRTGAPLAEQLAAALAELVEDARAAGLTLRRAPAGTSPPAPSRAGGQGPRPAPQTATRPSGPATPEAHAGPGTPAWCEGLLVAAADGGFGRVAGGELQPLDVPAAQVAELRDLLGLRDTVVALLELEAAERDETPVMRSRRDELGRRYRAYLSAFGPITRYTARPIGRADPSTGQQRTSRSYPRQGGFRDDPYAAAVYGLEHGYDPDRATALPADIFRRRVVAPRSPRRAADSPADALAICLDQHARVDLAVIGELLGVDPATARERLGDLVFTDPATGDPATGDTDTGDTADADEDRDDPHGRAGAAGAVLVPAAEYLSGDVRAKLAIATAAAERDPELARNVAALRAVVPTDLAPGEITAHLGAAWIDAAVVQTFMREVFDDPHARVEHPGGSVWEVQGARHGITATQHWGTPRRSAGELVATLCEQRPVRVTDTVETPHGTRQVLNVTDTLAAQDKARELAERFSSWVWEDPERARTLARVYNDRFNAVVLRSYDGAGPDTLSLPGLAEGFTPRPHQYAAVARMIAEPGVLLAHDVGAGKTAEIAMGVMELRRLGLVGKPAVVVPNHMLEQWAREFGALYPRARLLVATRDDLTPARRREFVARIATGDWDAVLMTRSAFERIPLSREAQQAYLDQETDRLTRWLDALGEGSSQGRGADRSVKRVQRMLLAAIERIKAKLDGAADPGISFEQTGIDYVCVDEAHLYKNLRTPSNIAGAAIEGSQRAQDLDMKLWWLRGQNGPRIVTLATATPVANSITETYVMQRYTRPDLLEAAGIDEFDQWAATFGQVVTTVEMTPDAAGFRLTDRFARFTNVPELLRLWHVSADIKTADDLALPVPALAPRPEDGARAAATVTVAPSDELREFVASLGERAEAIRGRRVHPSEDNMLKVCSEGRQAALDLRLLGRRQPGQATVDHAAATIARIWRAHRADRFTYPDGTPHPVTGALQIVFCDLGTPTGTGAIGGGFDVYHGLRDRLVARGMPAGAVRFIHEATTDAAKGALFAAARGGEVAVLIGSTEKMGVGANVQARAVALHHLDCPWRPADLHQRDGRIRRQGNPYPEVAIYRYITEGSFDGYSWQTVARKSAFIDQVMHGRLDVREIEDIGEATLSFDEVKALASGDPRVIEKARLDAEVATLERLQRAHWHTQRHLQHTITVAEETLARLDTEIAGLDRALAARRSTRGDGFTADLDGGAAGATAYTERTAFAADLAHTLATSPARARGEVVEIGHLGGLTVQHSVHRDPAGGNDREHHLEFAEAPGDPVVVTRDKLAAGGLGVVAALEHRHQRLDTRRRRAVSTRDNARRERALAHEQLGAPFARADELASKQARAEDLHRSMTDLARPGPEQADEQDADTGGETDKPAAA